MKKLLSLAALLSCGLCTVQLQGMEEREQPREEERKEQSSLTYIIQDKDNQAFEIDGFQLNQLKKAAKTIKFLLKDTKISSEDENNVISLPNLDHTIIQNILALTTQVSTIAPKYKHTLSKQSLANLITLLVAADYLNMPLTLDILSETITDKIIQELQPIQPSLLQQLFQKDSTESQKIDQWLQQNKATLDTMHSYLNHMLALKVNNYINNHPGKNNLTLASIFCPVFASYNIINFRLSNNPKDLTLEEALLKLRFLNQPITNSSNFKLPVIVKVLLKLFYNP